MERLKEYTFTAKQKRKIVGVGSKPQELAADLYMLFLPIATTEVRSQGVNTPYKFSRGADGWSVSLGSQTTSSMLGGEEEEMEAILKELLAAFPKETKRGEH